MHISVPVEGTVEPINFTQISPLVSKCQIKVLYIDDDKPNRNCTVISRELAERIGQKLPGSPIVGYYNEDSGDFEQHNKDFQYDKSKEEFRLIDTTKPYGFVPTNAKIWFQDFEDDDGVTRTYLCAEGIIWTEAYPESKRILSVGNNQSMEFDEETFSGNWAEELNSGRRFFIINEAIIEKLCILGEDFEPCFEGAQIKKTFSLSKALEELRYNMYSMIQDISIKGGFNFMEKDKTAIVELEQETSPAVEFEKKDKEEDKSPKGKENPKDNSNKETPSENENTTEKPAEEQSKEGKEDKKKKYNLNEIPEYLNLIRKYQELQISYSALEEEKKALSSELEPLRAFKLQKDREAKQEMIKNFYMLSDEDKKDVTDNIDTYSLDDIESKLSVICVRNKINFSEPKEENPNQFTYSLNSAIEQEDADIPEWIKAVRETEKKMN